MVSEANLFPTLKKVKLLGLTEKKALKKPEVRNAIEK